MSKAEKKNDEVSLLQLNLHAKTFTPKIKKRVMGAVVPKAVKIPETFQDEQPVVISKEFYAPMTTKSAGIPNTQIASFNFESTAFFKPNSSKRKRDEKSEKDENFNKEKQNEQEDLQHFEEKVDKKLEKPETPKVEPLKTSSAEIVVSGYKLKTNSFFHSRKSQKSETPLSEKEKKNAELPKVADDVSGTTVNNDEHTEIKSESHVSFGKDVILEIKKDIPEISQSHINAEKLESEPNEQSVKKDENLVQTESVPSHEEKAEEKEEKKEKIFVQDKWWEKQQKDEPKEPEIIEPENEWNEVLSKTEKKKKKKKHSKKAKSETPRRKEKPKEIKTELIENEIAEKNEDQFELNEKAQHSNENPEIAITNDEMQNETSDKAEKENEMIIEKRDEIKEFYRPYTSPSVPHDSQRESVHTKGKAESRRNSTENVNEEMYKPPMRVSEGEGAPTENNTKETKEESEKEKQKEIENYYSPPMRVSSGEPAPKEEFSPINEKEEETYVPRFRVTEGEQAPIEDEFLPEKPVPIPAQNEEMLTETKLSSIEDERIKEDNEADEEVYRRSLNAPPLAPSATPSVPQNVYSIDQMLDLRSKKVRARDSVYEIFQRFLIKKEKKEEKLINVDQSKAMYRQWFNQLTELTIDKVSSQMALQMRSKDDVETMLSILFKNAINERRYVQLYVKFFVKVRNAMLVVDTKKDLAIDMIKFLLGKAENQFTHPPTVRMPSENETDIERIEREDANAVDEFEYLGTVFLVSYLYTEGTVIADLVLQCLHSLSNIKGRLPTKAFTTLIKETCDKLVNEKVDMTDVLNTIKKMQAVDGISKFEQIVLENSKDQIIKATKLYKEKSANESRKGNTEKKKQRLD